MVEIAPENENSFSSREGRVEWSISSTKSSTAVVNLFLQKINQNRSTKLSGPRLFGFDIEPLYNFRLQIGLQPVTKDNNRQVLKPDHQYCICLYIGHENYKDLAKVGQLFQDQLFDLKNNGVIDQDGVNWPVELFFCGDWKFIKYKM
ncbi:unnamed protein product [Rhizophagus irregularis]|nr:unnamed protein product [Rhizophagus irregularis]CAB4378843.1 unnamed protein product [Rhizophagus irregularis]CAB4382913.1 unnamed protein product [Rhizophagus irregularis]CAB4383935.1 unnamed protein product [Rhizophagus irregularis]CAB4389452.1 unnamed protein product [Rhizophagus irregularis]